MTLPLSLARRTLPTVLLEPRAYPVRPLVVVPMSRPRDEKFDRRSPVLDDERGVRETVLVERVVDEDDGYRRLEELRAERTLDGDDERRALEEVDAERVTVGVLSARRRLELDGCRSLRLDERTLPTLPPRRTLPPLTAASSCLF